MMPPVEVPAIRSKKLEIGAPPRVYSMCAKNADGNTPLIPPPSIERILNRLISSHHSIHALRQTTLRLQANPHKTRATLKSTEPRIAKWADQVASHPEGEDTNRCPGRHAATACARARA